MPQDKFKPEGNSIAAQKLLLPKAIEFLVAAELSPFTRLTDILCDSEDNEVIIFETDVEVPQYPVNDIKSKEVIAVKFFNGDSQIPKVYALRKDFPSLPHELMEPQEIPRSLCLYNVQYEEVKLFWTGFVFLERIREWLKLSALGMLHQNDQPLEPLLGVDDGVIMLDIPFSKAEIFIYLSYTDHSNRLMLIGTNKNLLSATKQFGAQLEELCGTPQLHGIIKASPANLLELAMFLKDGGINLFDYLKAKLQEYIHRGQNLNNTLMLYVTLPKLRGSEIRESAVECFVFLTHENIATIGKKINLWADEGADLGLALLVGDQTNETGLAEIQVGILTPVYSFIPTTAARMNNIVEGTTTKMLAVGVGALGSQVLINLVRAAVGVWKAIDIDIFLPHNLSRHSLLGYNVMQPKVIEVAGQANSILPGAVEPIIGDVIKDIERPDIQRAVTEADVILDMSASSAVMRVLCDQKTRKRIVSYFLNPSGNSFIAIAEDTKLEYRATSLEGQFLRMILNTPDLHDHFNQDDQPFRYAPGCRDISIILPQDCIALASAMASKYTKRILQDDNASITVWRTDPETLDIKKFEAEVFRPLHSFKNNWTIFYDDYLIKKIKDLRLSKLPNETGGILIGNYDMQRRVINVLEIISSPVDSYEYPTAYIRGIKNVGEKLKEIKKLTGGGLQYIGEWHTHPKGFDSKMSNDDSILFEWMQANMYKEGLPAMMLIVGENYSFYIDK